MSDNASLIEELLAMVRELKPEAEIAAGDTLPKHLSDDMGLDSLDLINLLFRIEETWGVRVTGDDIAAKDLLIAGNLAAFIAANR